MKIQQRVGILMAVWFLMPVAVSAKLHKATAADIDQKNSTQASADKKQIASKQISPVQLDLDLDIINQTNREIQKNPGLSEFARNIKITSNDGAVTLRGQVASEEERQTVKDIVNRCGGVYSVLDQLQISE